MSRPSIELDIRIDDEGWRELGVDIEDACQSAVAAAASRTQTASVGVDMLLTSDAEMRRLNNQWRGKDKPTDVLSFPAGSSPPGGAPFLGDIALGLETCSRDAARLGRPMNRHIAHLAVHGFLHLLGYDHVETSDAETMEALEVHILGDLGYPDPYESSEPQSNTTPAQ